MKKSIALLLAALMLMAVLTGCGGSSKPAEEAPAAEAPAEAPAAEAPAAEAPAEAPAAEAPAAAEPFVWPTKQLEIVVPYNAGGDTDFYARTFGRYLADELGINVIITNMPGANGSVAHEEVANSAPDGSRCLFFHDSMLTNKATGIADFAYETLTPCAAVVDDNTYIMAVNSSSKYYTLDDVVNDAKARPGDFLYASQAGGYSYYLGRVFEEDFGVDFNIVDVGGGTDRNQALLAGKIDCNVNPYGVMKAYIDSGDFRVIATLSEERNELFPDVPTAKEQGYEWYGHRYYFLSFPGNTDPAIVGAMEQALKNCCENEACIKDCVDAYCIVPHFYGTAELMAHLEEALAEFCAHPELVTG